MLVVSVLLDFFLVWFTCFLVKRLVRPENPTGCPGSPPIREILPLTVMICRLATFPATGCARLEPKLGTQRVWRCGSHSEYDTQPQQVIRIQSIRCQSIQSINPDVTLIKPHRFNIILYRYWWIDVVWHAVMQVTKLRINWKTAETKSIERRT